MPTLRHTIEEATHRLSTISESPRLDTELLLAHALNLSRAQILARLDDDLSTESFDALLARRLTSEPIAYILGECEFYSIPLTVRPPTLIPRPETEHLVEVALELIPNYKTPRILDIGTGTGCIAIAIAQHAPNARILATDIKQHNLTLAHENAQRHQLQDRIQFRLGSLFDPIEEGLPQFHLICSNPPYIATKDADTLSLDIQDFEDDDALFSGDDGLDIIRTLIQNAPYYLHPGGYLLLEIGHDQHAPVTQLLEEHGYDDIRFQQDLAGIQRVAIGRKPQ